MKLAARTLPLSKRDWLVFDYLDGIYRTSYYRPERGFSDGGEPIPRARIAEIKPAKVEMPPKAAYRRFADKRKRFRDVLVTVLGEAEAAHDPDTVEAYVRATPWGAKLP